MRAKLAQLEEKVAALRKSVEAATKAAASEKVAATEAHAATTEEEATLASAHQRVAGPATEAAAALATAQEKLAAARRSAGGDAAKTELEVKLPIAASQAQGTLRHQGCYECAGHLLRWRVITRAWLATAPGRCLPQPPQP